MCTCIPDRALCHNELSAIYKIIYVNTSRHDHDMARPSSSDKHHYHRKRVSGGGGNGGGSARGDSNRASSSIKRQSSPPATAGAGAVVVPTWLSSREGLSNSASAPSGVGPESHDNGKGQHHNNNNNNNRLDCGSHAGNETMTTAATTTTTATTSRSSDSRGNHHHAHQANGQQQQTVNSLRRTSSNTSEASSGNGCGGGGAGVNSNNSTSSSTAGVSVAASNDPEVLKVEIHRLQAALMNEFKGGNRFVGGAQFKASSSSRNGLGAPGGNSCGGCLQVRVGWYVGGSWLFEQICFNASCVRILFKRTGWGTPLL